MYRHVKRGTTYQVEGIFDVDFSMNEGDDFVFFEEGDSVAYAEVQSSNPEGTRGQPMVVYYDDDLYFWARAKDEFFDGRFELIS